LRSRGNSWGLDEDRRGNMEKKKGKRILTKPSDFTYWNNWLIGRKNKDGTITGLLITNADEFVTSKEADPMKHKKRIMEGDFNYICGLIEESPYHLKEPVLQKALQNLEQELSHNAPFNNESKEKLKRLNQARITDTRGKKDVSMKNIKRDIAIFRTIINEKERQQTRNVKGIIEKSPTLLKKVNIDIEKDSVRKIIKIIISLPENAFLNSIMTGISFFIF
jgi:hypothetical protein